MPAPKSEAKPSLSLSIGHKPRLLHVSRWYIGQTEKSKYTSNKSLSNMNPDQDLTEGNNVLNINVPF